MKENEWREVLTNFGLNADKAFRRDQFRGAELIDRVFLEDVPSLLLEAPTGVGKTLMYLGAFGTYAPGDVKAVVSTSGKLLQQQIAGSARKLGIEPVILMGRANYLCRSACAHYLAEMPEDHPLRSELEKLCALLDVADTHELKELLNLEKWSSEFVDFMRHYLTASSAYCRNDHPGNPGGGCFYGGLVRLAQNAPLLILNHHALFTLDVSPLFQDRVLVADEAHALPEAASSVLTESVSSLELRSLQQRAESCREVCPEAVDKFRRMLESVIKILRNNADDKICVPGPAFWQLFKLDVFPPVAFDKSVLARCDAFHRSILEELNAAWSEIRNFLDRMKAVSLPDGVRYFEPSVDGKDVTLKYVPIDTGAQLAEFWAQWKGTVGLSATLTRPGAKAGTEFDYFRSRCGFPKPAETRVLASPFKLKAQCLAFVPDTGTRYDCRAESDPEGFLKSRLELAGGLIEAFDGRTLALFTATGRLTAAAEVLRPLFQEGKVLSQCGAADNDELAKSFIDDERTALLGTRTFFQGFDAPGATLSCEVLEKLPFPRRDDPVLEEQCRRVRERGGDEFDEVILPAMLMDLRQAFGRLIRSTTDRGVFVLTDPRLRVKNYRAAVEQALEGVTIAGFSSPEDLLVKIPAGFLPFSPKSGDTGFRKKFAEEWERFRETPLFRQLTGIVTQEEVRKRLLGDRKLYGWQQQIVDNVLAGVPAQFVIYPAGSGKSLTYQIPALMRPGLTLVISPLKSLMHDQLRGLVKKGLGRQVAVYNSSLGDEERKSTLEQVKNGTVRLLYVAPERLHKSFIEMLLNLPQGIAMLVIDEAHMIHEAGSNWRPFYGELRHAWEQLGKPQLMAVTATATQYVRQDIQKQFDIRDGHVSEMSVIRPRVELSVRNANHRVDLQKRYALEFVLKAAGEPVLIYCSTIRYIHDLRDYLSKKGVPDRDIGVYYTGKYKDRYIDPTDLNITHENFLNDRFQVMIATNAYGMGIDKPNIWGVFFYNVPTSLEELVQGGGRVCRDPNLLQEHSNAGHPAQISVAYNYADIVDQQGWKIEKPFDATKALALGILEDIQRVTAPCRGYRGYICDHQYRLSCARADDELDEERLRACILLARWMLENKYIASMEFDWKSSNFSFLNVTTPPATAAAGFAAWIDGEKQKRIDQLYEVAAFCETAGCRNEFLQTAFTGKASDGLCMYCDRCGYDLRKHLEYVEKIGSAWEHEASRFVYGAFQGDDAAFLRYLRNLPEKDLPAQIAYLRKEHRESGRESTDAACAVLLLELRMAKHDDARVVELCGELLEKPFDRIRSKEQKRTILLPLSTDCGISPELWKLLREVRTFADKRRNAAAPRMVSVDFLRECREWERRIGELPTSGLSAAVAVRLRRSFPELAGFMLDHAWRDCVEFIKSGNALERMFAEDGDAGDWQRFARHLRAVVGWEKSNPEKLRYLGELLATLPEKERAEWTQILSAPADYLRIAEADPELLGCEKHWEPEWFSGSALVRSKLERCLTNAENIIIHEAEEAAEKMPMNSWADLREWMPCTAKLCPMWKELLDKIVEKRLTVNFPNAIPAEIAAAHRRLPNCLKDFLKRMVFIRKAAPATKKTAPTKKPERPAKAKAQPEPGKKSAKKELKDFSGLSMNWISSGEK